MKARQPWWRFGYLLVCSLALLAVIVQPSSALASSSGTLFAMTGTNQNLLARVDPASGTVTPIVDLAGANQGQVGSLAGDPATHRIFGVRTSVTFDSSGFPIFTIELLTINSQTGTFTVSPPVNSPIGEIGFDASSNTLFGLAFNAVVKIDPNTGSATNLAALGNTGGGILSMAVAPKAHTIYVNNETQQPFTGATSSQILSIDSQTGAVTTGPVLNRALRSITYDTSTGALLGVTECCARDLLQVDPVTGTETVAGSVNSSNDQIFTFHLTTDPATHAVYLDMETVISNFPPQVEDHIITINDQTGVTTVGAAIASGLGALYFESPPAITAESIKADVRSALASGAINNRGTANSLLSKLNEASDARSRGQCAKAAHRYNSFIKELNAQSGKHVAKATADQLIGEANFLIANCP